jgi:hypothetical protein
VLAAQRFDGALGGGHDLIKCALGGGQQVDAFARALLGHQRIAAGHQAFAGIREGADFGQILLIKQ